MKVSTRATQLLGQPMFKMRQKIGDKDVIHLEIGDPDFDTPCNIKNSAIKSLVTGETHYCDSYGMPEFIEAIQYATQRSRGFKPATKQILVTPGANIGIFYAVYCCCNPGDSVLIPDPGFPTYTSAVIAAGCNPVYYPLAEDLSIDPELLRETIRNSNAKLAILNSPSNPTGAVTGLTALRKIYNLLELYNIIGYSDEIYARITYDDTFTSISAFDHCRDRIILSNGFSKAYAMTGWRLGAMIAPQEITERMMLLLQTTQSCVQPFIQRAGIEAIISEQDEVTKMIDSYKLRRDVMVAGLNEFGFDCSTPGGAFYVFPSFKRILGTTYTSEDIADKILTNCGVAVLPGTDFGRNGEGHIRLTYATSMTNIVAALRQLRRLA